MAKLKFKTGDKVIFRFGVGGFGKPKELNAEILLAGHRLKKFPPYIIRTKKFDYFALQRDLKHR